MRLCRILFVLAGQMVHTIRWELWIGAKLKYDHPKLPGKRGRRKSLVYFDGASTEIYYLYMRIR